MPSLNQIKEGIILTNLILIEEKSKNEKDAIQIKKSYENFETAFSVLFEMAELGDLNEPISEKSLMSNPDDPMVQTIIYLYSLEPPFYGHLNWASREKVINRIDAVGPFA